MAGVSDNENKQLVRDWIVSLEPQDVLDVGAGVGTYSILAKMPNQNWTALEVFAPYVEMFNLEGKYDRVIVADARFVDYGEIGQFDLTIAADVLEHMSKTDAKALVKRLFESSKRLLVSVPVIHNEQSAGAEGNHYETHVEHWHPNEMRDFLETLTGVLIEKEVVGTVSAYFLACAE